jgi:O-antigen ligase
VTVLGRGVLTTATLALLGGLLALSTTGLLAALLALSCAVVLMLLVVLGPERLGTCFVLLAMFTAPQNAVRPIPSADFVTFSDVFLLVGAALLLPTLLTRRGRYPLLFLVGAVGVTSMVLLSAAIGPDPVPNLVYGLRLPAAAVVLPLFFLAWRPPDRLTYALAWAYVAGHVVSTCWALVEGKSANARYDGLTTHFNFFGIAALVASTMLVHLFHATPRRHRWTVVVAAAFCAGSISMSGSRAAALVVIMILLLYPLLERSVLSAYLLIAAALGFVVVGDRLLGGFGNGSVIERLQGDETTVYSDNERTNALQTGWDKFLAHPILGHGFDATALDAHNIYLEVAIGIGVVGLVCHLLLLGVGVLPVLRSGPLRRLGYVALGYAAIGLLTNSLWDRFVWMGLSLSVLAAADMGPRSSRPRDEAETADESGPCVSAAGPSSRVPAWGSA